MPSDASCLQPSGCTVIRTHVKVPLGSLKLALFRLTAISWRCTQKMTSSEWDSHNNSKAEFSENLHPFPKAPFSLSKKKKEICADERTSCGAKKKKNPLRYAWPRPPSSPQEQVSLTTTLTALNSGWTPQKEPREIFWPKHLCERPSHTLVTSPADAAPPPTRRPAASQ